MRGILLVVLLAAACKDKRAEPKVAPPAPAAAAPHHSRPAPALPAPKPLTHKLGRDAFVWSFAEASNTAGAWDAAAESLEQELASCKSNCGETAYAILLARKNALVVEPIQPPPGDDPIAELPPRVQAALDAIDQYVRIGDATDPDVSGARFLGANITYRWRQLDEAIDRLTAILKLYRNHPTAEYAANQLLDLLNRLGRFDELRRWTAELLADSAFLADKPELRSTLEHLRDTFAADGP